MGCCLCISQTCSATRRAAGPSLPGAITRTRRLSGAPRPARGPSPQEGLEFLPGGPLLPPLPGARFLPLPARPPPGCQPTACPRGRQEATCPRKECRACRAGGGRWAGLGRAGSAPPGRWVRGKEPARTLARPVRRPGLIAASHTLPARHADGTTRGLPGLGVPWRLEQGGSAQPGQPPPPSARPRPGRLGGGGRPSCFPTPLPAAAGFGAPVGSRGLISRGAGVWPAGPRVVSHTRCSPSPGASTVPARAARCPGPKSVAGLGMRTLGCRGRG